MKASNNKQLFFAPILVGLGFLTLFFFQNCSEDVSFDSRPSAERPDDVLADGINPNGPGLGGNSNVIIRLNETPGDSTVDNGTSVIDYEVVTPNGTITDVQCQLNGQAVACNPSDRIPITNPPVGPNTFTITGTNSDGQTGSETVTWVIYNSVVMRTRDISVDVVGDQVDIIINVDNSGSMEYEQTSMASRISSFMSPFADLDYHIAVTTTSPIGNNEIWKPSLDYVDGKFVELSSNLHCIKKGQQSLQQAQTLISNNVVRDLYLRDDNGDTIINPLTQTPYPEGNGWERGIFTTFRAFERSEVNTSVEADCLRANVAKHVIVISDERETLADDLGNPLSDLNKSSGAALRAKVAEIYGAQTLFKFHSIIVNPFSEEGQACLASHGARPGVEYGQLSLDTGGFIGSVCASDYSTQLNQIGQAISNSALSYALGCVAVANNGDMGSVVNTANNQPISTAFQFNGDKVEFAQRLGAGNYRVSYYCFQ